MAVLLFDIVAIIAGFITALARGRAITLYVASTGYMDYLSFVQLLFIAFLAFLIFIVWQNRESTEKLNKDSILWAFIIMGSLFLAIDQLLWFHDKIGEWLVTLLNIRYHFVVDRAGDFILLFMGLIALVLVIIFKSELMKFKSAFPVLIAEIPIILLLVALYALTTSTDILEVYTTAPGSVEECLSWF